MSSPLPPPAPGDTIGPYRLESEIGRGGFGRVFRARDTRLGRVVAIKFVSPASGTGYEFRQRFLREAQTISSLNHPNVCALYDTVEHGDRACLIMEYVEGETLFDVLTRGPLPIDEARRIVTDIASGLAAVHALGIVHRDLKPANIMVTPVGAKVLDFGVAWEASRFETQAETTLAASGPTEASHLAGGPAYASPERVMGNAMDARSDVFAAGIILYQMLTGRHPFPAAHGVERLVAIVKAEPPPLAESGRAIPRDLAAIVTRALQKSPAERFASGAELLKTLEGAEP